MRKIFFTAIMFTAASASATTMLNGAPERRSHFPLYSKWSFEYGKVDSNTRINYQSIGSGGGICKSPNAQSIFSASDAPMTDEQLGKERRASWRFAASQRRSAPSSSLTTFRCR